MASHLSPTVCDYRAASLALTVALAEMAQSIDTPAFNDRFWKVQRASEACKQVRAIVDRTTNCKNYSLVAV